MFQRATEAAVAFTYPVIVSTLRRSGSVDAQIAAFIVVNSDGWAVTCAHVFRAHFAAQRDRKAADDWQAKVDALNADNSLTAARRKALLRKFPADSQWITRLSYWWGFEGVTASELHLDPLADLALVRLNNLPSIATVATAIFGDPAHHPSPGASLCRLGFPFNTVATSWNSGKGTFEFQPGTLPVSRFPLEGMHTRTAVYEDPKTGRTANYLETSTPGLRGQSGGPIYDVDGTVWAIQSQTTHLELGFSPEVTVRGKKTVEHQILNLGLGADVTEVIRFAAHHSVALTLRP
jgi:hypothetical protein